MARALLCALYVAVAACVIPTPLEQAELTPNYGPVVGQGTPLFGPLVLGATDVVELSVSADDPNLDDTLTMRLFTQDNSATAKRRFAAFEGRLDFPTLADPMHPTRRSGKIPTGGSGLAICALYGNKDQPLANTFLLSVVVADRPFSNVTGEEQLAPGGLTDESYWVVTCSP